MNALAALCLLALVVSVAQAFGVEKRSVAVQARGHDFRTNCLPEPSNGCRCTLTNTHNVEEVMNFAEDAQCKVPVEIQTAANKAKLNEELLAKHGGMRDNCAPKPSGGCRCTVTNNAGDEETVTFNADESERCRKPVEIQTAEKKQALNEEINEKFGDLKENCFPKPSGGCRCVEKDAAGAETEKRYETDAECKVPARASAARRRRDIHQQRPQSPTGQSDAMRGGAKDQQRPQSPPSQDVRDPVREKAQANYALVVEELKEKFKGLKDGCYPRPKGCLCVIGKDIDGRDQTERRMNDVDCKCREGERSRECPAPAA